MIGDLRFGSLIELYTLEFLLRPILLVQQNLAGGISIEEPNSSGCNAKTVNLSLRELVASGKTAPV